MQIKLASLGLIITFAAAAVAAWATSPAFTGQAQAVSEAMQGTSVQELQQRIDIKSLPVHQIADPI